MALKFIQLGMGGWPSSTSCILYRSGQGTAVKDTDHSYKINSIINNMTADQTWRKIFYRAEAYQML